MLNTKQRWIVFSLFCLFATACVALEVFIVWAVVQKGFSTSKTAATLVSGTVLALVGRSFWQLVTKTFLHSTVMPSERLHRFMSERCALLENAQRSSQETYLTRQNLITNTLRFSEECLKGWVAGTHFELCVFVDEEQPLLFSYFDSNHDIVARSMREREQNPRFYIEKRYEVTKLLQAPTSQPRILRDTHDPKAKYVFTTKEQRKQLKSSILICMDVTRPCALVVSSNAKNAFDDSDSEVISFIKFVGESVRYDLLEGEFIAHIRELKPTLFQLA